MEENLEKPEITGNNQEIRDEKGKFVRGVSGNPAGRPKDSLSFKTKWLMFIDKIAEQNNITPDEVDKQMLTVAYKQMQSGDFRYWKDIQDRVYGTAVNKTETDITSKGEKITGIELIVPNVKDNISPDN